MSFLDNMGSLFSDPSTSGGVGITPNDIWDSGSNMAIQSPYVDGIIPDIATGLTSEELGGYGDYGPFQSASSATDGASGVANFLKKLFGGSQPGQNLSDLSSVLAGFTSGEKANRVIQGNFTQNYDRNMLQAQQDRNLNESDALKKLAQTSYITGGGSHFQLPTSLSLGGSQHSVPNLGYGPQAPTQAETQGASTLQSQLLARLMPGGSYTPQPLSSYATPGTAENVGNYAGPGAGAAGAIANIFLPQGQGNNGSNS